MKYFSLGLRFMDIELVLRYLDEESAKVAYEEVCEAWTAGQFHLEMQDAQAKWCLKLDRLNAVRLIDDDIGVETNEAYNKWFKDKLDALRANDKPAIGFQAGSKPSGSQDGAGSTTGS